MLYGIHTRVSWSFQWLWSTHFMCIILTNIVKHLLGVVIKCSYTWCQVCTSWMINLWIIFLIIMSWRILQVIDNERMLIWGRLLYAIVSFSFLESFVIAYWFVIIIKEEVVGSIIFMMKIKFLSMLVLYVFIWSMHTCIGFWMNVLILSKPN